MYVSTEEILKRQGQQTKTDYHDRAEVEALQFAILPKKHATNGQMMSQKCA